MIGKTPIWKIQEKQNCRVLRPSEARLLFSHVNAKLPSTAPFASQVRFVATSTVQKWLYALLFTGMRPAELFKVHERPDLLKPEGFIHLEKSIAWDTGKKTQTNRERNVYLSDAGIKVVRDFLDAPTISDDFSILVTYLDNVLYQAAASAGFEKRRYPYREKVRYFQFLDGSVVETTARGSKHVPEGAKLVIRKIARERESTGIMLRSFRKTWDSWLINSFATDQNKLMLIEDSIGHSVQTAMKHYLTFQFDEEDMAEIRQATAGWGMHTPKADATTP
jgi:integrase